MKDYKEDLTKSFNEMAEWDPDLNNNKFLFIAAVVFDIHTYDDDLDESFTKHMIEVIDCILNRKTYEYIEKSRDNYINYCLMVNMPFLKGKLEYGASIRGAWFQEFSFPNDQEKEYEILPDIKIPKNEIIKFMSDLIEWAKL